MSTGPEDQRTASYPFDRECFEWNNIGGEYPHVLNLVWTWSFCCKLEIVCADDSP